MLDSLPKMTCVLLDIEGTTSSVQYVYEVLFPYVRGALPSFLETHWEEPTVQAACERIAQDATAASPDAWTPGRAAILAEALRLMDLDSKAGGLKDLQGLVSRAGYESGGLRSHFYPDVPPFLETLTRQGVRCCVYSSGSIDAQKNFYRYAAAGDLTPYISGNFDTTSGPKREAASYTAIANALKLPPQSILFCSDVLAELDAASKAGMETVLVVRPGNKAVTEPHTHRVAHSLSELLTR